jgi:hypothetical protein
MRRNIDGHVGPNWLAKSLVTIVKVVRSEQIEKFEKVGQYGGNNWRNKHRDWGLT